MIEDIQETLSLYIPQNSFFDPKSRCNVTPHYLVTCHLVDLLDFRSIICWKAVRFSVVFNILNVNVKFKILSVALVSYLTLDY